MGSAWVGITALDKQNVSTKISIFHEFAVSCLACVSAELANLDMYYGVALPQLKLQQQL